MTIESSPVGGTDEVAPGVTVERRSFLGLCSAAVLGIGGRQGALPAEDEEPRLGLEEFLEEVLPVARELRARLADTPLRRPEDRYLFTIASYAVRLGEVPLPEFRPTPQGEGVGIGANWAGDPFVVLHWRMRPGSSIRLHAHTYGNVCTVGLEGSARVRNYETIEPLDIHAVGAVDVRQTQDQLLTPGSINLVPLSHGFCHGFDAGSAGARGLDITTRLGDRKPTGYLKLEQEPRDPERRVYAGRWSVE